MTNNSVWQTFQKVFKKITLITWKTISKWFSPSVLSVWMLILDTAKSVIDFALERSAATLIYFMRPNLWWRVAFFLDILAWIYWVQEHLPTLTHFKSVQNQQLFVAASSAHLNFWEPETWLTERLVGKGQSKTQISDVIILMKVSANCVAIDLATSLNIDFTKVSVFSLVWVSVVLLFTVSNKENKWKFSTTGER